MNNTMDNITESFEKINIGKNKVLYYSVTFEYKTIIHFIKEFLFKSTDKNDFNHFSGIYTKTLDSFELFDDKITDQDLKNSLYSEYSTHIDKIKTSENFIIYDKTFFTTNTEFHITTLFTGGKVHEKSQDLEAEINKKVYVKVNKLAISENFITLGVESIKFNDGKDITYYGNDVKHITIALNKTGKKKVFPKDSYTALTNGKIYDIDYTFHGKTNKVTQ